MKAEAKFNDSGEPTITVFPETKDEIDVICTMRGKHRREDGDHMLVMGIFVNEGVVECATFTTNPVGHPTTFLYQPDQLLALQAHVEKLRDVLEETATIFDDLDTVQWDENGCPVTYQGAQEKIIKLLTRLNPRK